jgi:hypothetical protein
MFVLCEHSLIEGSGEPLGVLGDVIASQLPATHLHDLIRGKLRIKDMNRFEVLQIAMSESSVEQEGFPQPWLSQERHTCLPSLQALNKSLESGLIASTQEEPVWSGRARERVVLQGIKIAIVDSTLPSLKNNAHVTGAA